MPRNILLVSADKTVEIVDVDVSSHRRIHARCSIFISCIATPIGGYRISRIFQGVGNDLKRHDYAVGFHELALATTSTPSRESAQLVHHAKNLKNHLRIQRDNKFTVSYASTCFSYQQSLWRIGANRCSISLPKHQRKAVTMRVSKNPEKINLASKGVFTPKNLAIWPLKDMSTFKAPWLKVSFLLSKHVLFKKCQVFK